MAWSWSHTHEAYDYARNELEKLPYETLLEIDAEWQAAEYTDEPYAHTPEFNIEKFNNAMQALSLPTEDELAERIWDRANEQRTCDNGGWNAWMCPFGCHTVNFGPEMED